MGKTIRLVSLPKHSTAKRIFEQPLFSLQIRYHIQPYLYLTFLLPYHLPNPSNTSTFPPSQPNTTKPHPLSLQNPLQIFHNLFSFHLSHSHSPRTPTTSAALPTLISRLGAEICRAPPHTRSTLSSFQPAPRVGLRRFGCLIGFLRCGIFCWGLEWYGAVEGGARNTTEIVETDRHTQ